MTSLPPSVKVNLDVAAQARRNRPAGAKNRRCSEEF
jgi:hypothetical protein